MSSSGSAITAQVIATYQELTTVITLNIVVTALLLYDVILTSGREYQYIWRSPKSWVSRVLYMWNRYMFLFNLLVNLGTIPAISVTITAYQKPPVYLPAPLNCAQTDTASRNLSIGVADYLKKAERRLREEDHVEQYMDTNTRKALIQKCQQVPIRQHAKLMWENS
ncbi:hypothetical protein VTO73DRAFT_14502 [Trametes versicolor]